jgi:CheY-like chemotaxis protein
MDSYMPVMSGIDAVKNIRTYVHSSSPSSTDSSTPISPLLSTSPVSVDFLLSEKLPPFYQRLLV